MNIIKTKPIGEFQDVQIDHQYLEGIEIDLDKGIGRSSGTCFYADAVMLEAKFGRNYAFLFQPETAAEGMLYLIPVGQLR